MFENKFSLKAEWWENQCVFFDIIYQLSKNFIYLGKNIAKFDSSVWGFK